MPRSAAAEAASAKGDAAAGPAPAGVAPEGGSPGLLAELREIVVDELWESRELVFQLTRRDIRLRYKQAVMGLLWALLMPILIVLSGTIVRFAMAYLSGEPLETTAVTGMTVKALPWAFFVGSVGFATSSVSGNLALVTKTAFPREALPVSATLAQGFDTAIGVAALAVVLPFMGATISASGLIWTLMIGVMLFAFTLGTALLVGCANLFFRDVKYIVQVLLTFGIFFTPVFFEPAMFGPLGASMMMVNPLAPMLEGLRLVLVDGHDLLRPLVQATPGGAVVAWSPIYLLYGGVWSVAVLIGGAIIFHRLEFVFAEFA